MTRILILLSATALAPPALAQTNNQQHAAHSATATQPAQTTLSSDPHAEHASASEPADDPHAGHEMQPAQEAPDPHAGHSMPVSQPNSGHTAQGHEPGIPDPPVGPPPPAALHGPPNAADAVFGTGVMTDARGILRREHGDITTYNVLIDQMESRITKGRDGYFISAQGWYCGAIDRLLLQTAIASDFRQNPGQA